MQSSDAPAFIISLDCEGKWGLLDHLTPEIDNRLTDNKLVRAYADILDVFRKHETPATFAFVSAFCLSRSDAGQWADRLRSKPFEGGDWTADYWEQLKDGNLEGWHLPQTLEMTQEAQIHEISSHGFCHLPLGHSAITRQQATEEFAFAREAAKDAGFEPQTYIYPRNGVQYADVLTETGWLGWRDFRTKWNGPLLRSARELNILDRADAHGSQAAQVPAGFFLNWRYGIRRKIPMSVTIRRWKSIIDDAARRNRVAHLWLHPHNVIDSPETLLTLDAICRYAKQQREAGRLSIETMLTYLNGRGVREG